MPGPLDTGVTGQYLSCVTGQYHKRVTESRGFAGGRGQGESRHDQAHCSSFCSAVASAGHGGGDLSDRSCLRRSGDGQSLPGADGSSSRSPCEQHGPLWQVAIWRRLLEGRTERNILPPTISRTKGTQSGGAASAISEQGRQSLSGARRAREPARCPHEDMQAGFSADPEPHVS